MPLKTWIRPAVLMLALAAVSSTRAVAHTEVAKLTATDAARRTEFGSSVSVDGNVAIVGASEDECAGGLNCGSAYVYRLSGSSWVEEQKLTASDATSSDYFGDSVSVHNNVALVGARWASSGGAAYVFRFDGSSWIEEQVLTASDANPGDYFGASVVVAGDVAMVGASHDDCAAGPDCGSVYVYRFNGSSWVEDQKLTASDLDNGDYFGDSVSFDGSVAIVGAPGYDCYGYDCGSAYIYRFDGLSWIEEQKLIASDAFDGDSLGTSVSVSGEVVIAGAYGDDCGSYQEECGAAYVFRFNGSAWVEEKKLTTTDRGHENYFGWSVAIAGDAAVIGAREGDWAEGYRSGSAYVFWFNGTRWVETEEFTASDAASYDWLGYSVSIGDGVVFLGAPQDDCADGEDCGSAYIFSLTAPSCGDEEKLSLSDPEQNDAFGVSVSLSGDVAIVGAPGTDWAAGNDCGSASVYQYDGADWIEEQELTASDAATGELFGHSVSVSDNVAIVGTVLGDGTAGEDCGAAYVFRFNGSSWLEEQKLTASDATEAAELGYSASISGDVAIVGALADDCTAGDDCGAAYVFRFNGSSWVEEQKLTASDAEADALFGRSVSVSGNVAIVGMDWDDCTAGDDCGAAYVFRFNGSSWVEEQKLTASDATEAAWFGYSTSISGNVAVVGAPYAHCHTYALECGAAYVYRFTGSSWVEEQKLISSRLDLYDLLGVSVSVSGNLAVVGAIGDGWAAGSSCGSAYVYRFDGSDWVEEHKLTAFDASGSDLFGNAVAANGNVALVGAGIVCGACAEAAYVFTCVSVVYPPLTPSSPHDRAKNRFISFEPNSAEPVAIKVEMMDLACSVTGKRCLTDSDCQFCLGGSKDGMPCDGPAACPDATCPVGETCNEVGSPVMLGWVGEPVEAGNDAPAETMTAQVVASPVERTWTESVVHVADCEIAPVHAYLLSATATLPDGPFSDALRVDTIARPEAKFWADCVGNYTGTEWTAPNGLVNVDDVVAFINFKTFKPAPHITAIELAGSPPSYVNFIVNVTDLGLILQGFRAVPYPPLPFVLDGYPADMNLTNCP